MASVNDNTVTRRRTLAVDPRDGPTDIVPGDDASGMNSGDRYEDEGVWD